MPFQRANKPSSLAIVATVPNNPLYLEPSPDPALFCNCSLTLAVSRGKVQSSAKQAAAALIAKIPANEISAEL